MGKGDLSLGGGREQTIVTTVLKLGSFVRSLELYLV